MNEAEVQYKQYVKVFARTYKKNNRRSNANKNVQRVQKVLRRGIQ